MSSPYSNPSACDFSGRWNPSDMVVSPVGVVSSESEMKSWPRLALGILKLDPKTLRTVDNCDIMNIKHTPTTITVQNVQAMATSQSILSTAPALSLVLDNKPHTFNTSVGTPSNAKLTAADLTITACQLDESDDHDLLIKIEFPPRDKKGVPVKKFTNFAEEQIAKGRAGYILERSHKFTDQTLTQFIEYHRAPNSMKDSAIVDADITALPTVYSITRTYRRINEDEPLTHSRTSSFAFRSRNNSPLRSSPSAIPSTPIRSVMDSLVPASPSLSASSASSPIVGTSTGPTISIPSTPSTPAFPLSQILEVRPSPTPSVPLPYCTLSGSWKVDKSRSDSLDEMMKELGVPWLARKVVLQLDVTTKIVHDPSQHTCTVTDSSSAGEQATVHSTLGQWTEVTTKEGKTIRMCAKEGEEMRAIWSDLPSSQAPLMFEASSEPFQFPSYMPLPISPSQKTHPFTYGYLWIHSHLPDIPGGEMQDVRMLLDRTCMLQCTQVLKDKKLVSTTTRYFTKQETDEERAQGEREWEEKMDKWKALQPTIAENDNDDNNGGSSASSFDPSSSSSSSTRASGPQPNLSGTWSVIKERSNDLSVLLKRMGVPWYYRAFASTVNIKTHITHTSSELVLKDTSKFGAHIQTLKLGGAWFPVTQYGKQRRGLCKVLSDPTQQSVTIETVYLTSVKNKPRIALPTGSTPVPSPSTSTTRANLNAAAPTGLVTPSSTSLLSTSPALPLLYPRSNPVTETPSKPRLDGEEEDRSSLLLTSDATTNSPGPKPISSNDSLVREEDETSIGTSALATSTTTRREIEDKNETKKEACEESKEESVATNDTYPSNDSTVSSESSSSSSAGVPLSAPVATSSQQMAFDLTELGEEGSAPDLSPFHRPPAIRPPSISSMTAASMTPIVTPTTSNSMTIATATPSPFAMHSRQSSATFSPLPVTTPSAAPSYGQIVSSSVIDARVLLPDDTMRQVITYLEYGTVVCVCSRVFKREIPKSGPSPPTPKMRDEPDSKDDNSKSNSSSAKPSPSNSTNSTSSAGSSVPSTPSSVSGGPSPTSTSSASSHSHSHRPTSAAPVNVVVPSLVSDTVKSPPIGTDLTLTHITPARAVLAFIFVAAVASGSSKLVVLVLAGLVAYGYQYYSALQSDSSHSTPQSTHSSSNTNKPKLALRPSIQLGPGLEVEVVPLRREA